MRNIKDLLAALGPTPKAIVMVVLHRLFDRPSRLREVLQVASDMPVIVAADGQKLRSGCCYIGEPAAHLTLMAASYGDITADAARQHRNRTVDLLFKSVAAHAGPRAIGVILSGALDDGSRGIEAVHDAGGLTMVLLRSDKHIGMPENAMAYDGPIDCIGTTDRGRYIERAQIYAKRFGTMVDRALGVAAGAAPPWGPGRSRGNRRSD